MHEVNLRTSVVRLADIPRFIPGGHYAVDVHFGYMNEWINGHLRDMDVDLDPDYQRGHVWTDEQRTKYVEFMLRGGESSNIIHWNHPSWMCIYDPRRTDLPNALSIVDGKQRVTAVLRFMRNELPAFGHYYEEFEDAKPYTGLGGPRLRMCVNNLSSRRDLLTWYLQLNDGGTVHSREELDRVRGLLEECKCSGNGERR